MITSESKRMDVNFRVQSAEFTVDGLNFHACLNSDGTYRLTLDGDYRGSYGSYECAVEAAQHFADKMILGKNFRLNEEVKKLKSENADLAQRNGDLQESLNALKRNGDLQESLNALKRATFLWAYGGRNSSEQKEAVWNDGDAPWRGGSLWSSSENQALLRVFAKGLSIATIAKIHRRTENAILCRLKYLGVIIEGSGGKWYRVGTEIYNGGD